ncbi:MAG: bifunctional riboflavin kinase/FAD synthetase [candidate division Zixibacteria bacterium]
MSLKVFTSADEYAKKSGGPCVATLGTFDGFHKGHASIFSRLIKVSQDMNLPAVVITFHPHPRVLVTPDNPPQLLTVPDEKIEILKSRLDGSLVFLTFNDKLRRMTAEEFAKNVLIERFGIKSLVVGYNHSFGRDRSGNIDHLREMGRRENFDVNVVGPVTYRDLPISSSRIRRAIQSGEWRDAIAMLGHHYPIYGTVVKGLGKGKQLGWPTMNIDWSERKMLPPQGVYSCLATLDEHTYKGMMFIGVNMLNPEKRVSVEAHLFDFNKDVYGKQVTLYPSHFLRSSRRFESVEALSHQIADDKEKIERLLH